MRKIVLFLIFCTVVLFASTNNKYNIKLHGIKVGTIDNFSTIDKGYLVGKPKGGLLNLLTPFDNYIIYEPNKKPELKGKNKYKKDKYLLLELIKQLQNSQPKHKIFTKDHYEINMSCKNSVCTYVRLNKKKQKRYDGYLSFKDGILLEICDDESGICFKRIEDDS